MARQTGTGQSVSINSAGIDSDLTGLNLGLGKRRMSEDNRFSIILLLADERLTDPQQVFLSLLDHGNSGPPPHGRKDSLQSVDIEQVN